jgi:hypothetical protein
MKNRPRRTATNKEKLTQHLVVWDQGAWMITKSKGIGWSQK